MHTARLPRRAALKLGAAIVGLCLVGGGQQDVSAQTPAPAQIPGPPAATTPPSASSVEGTWLWQRTELSDGTTITAADPSKYVLGLLPAGQMTLQADCNRGSGSWESAGPSDLRFGPLAITRAMCPPGSMHDRIVRDMEYIRSYVIEEGHLFLSLMADGGIYEYEPAAAVDEFPGT